MRVLKNRILLFLIVGLSISGLIYVSGRFSIQTQDIYFNPSEPDNWEEKDKSLELHGRIYYPSFYSESQEFLTILMFHGKGRDLEDNDYFARKLAGMGILCFSISFRGHGNSEGKFDSSSNANITFGDALGAYRYIHEEASINIDKLIAHGTSMGGGISVYLATQNLSYNFVVWYPALAYISGNTPIYKYNSNKFEGLILAGTEDECEACLPKYNKEFISNNDDVDIKWLEGATHTDSAYFLECVDKSVSWISEFWNVQSTSLLFDLYLNGILAGIIAFGVVIFTIFWFVKRRLKGKDKKEKK